MWYVSAEAEEADLISWDMKALCVSTLVQVLLRRAATRPCLCRHSVAQPSTSSPVDLTSVPDSDVSDQESDEDSDGQYHSACEDQPSSTEQTSSQHALPSVEDTHQLPFNVMLTCYTLFERDSMDQQADRSFLKKWQWSHLILDEAHAVKNAGAMRTKRLTRYATVYMQTCTACLCDVSASIPSTDTHLDNCYTIAIPNAAVQ